MPAKALVSLRKAQDFAESSNASKSTRKSTQGTRLGGVAQSYILLSSWASVGWSEPVNIIIFLVT